MTRTNVIFSAVDFVENLRKALGYPTPNVIEEKIKGMFDDAGFADFKDKLRTDMENRVWCTLLATMDVDGISNESTNWYLHEVITNNMNIWYSVDVNHDEIISEILHDASGYLAINLTDKQFEEWHEWFDTNIPVWRWVDICTSKFDNQPITEHLDIIERFCKDAEWDINVFLKDLEENVAEEQIEETRKNYPYKQVLDFNMGSDINEVVYAIINTKTYDGDMGIIIIKAISPLTLIDYGFDANECTEIGQLGIGQSWSNSFYGNGVVVVRMA